MIQWEINGRILMSRCDCTCQIFNRQQNRVHLGIPLLQYRIQRLM